MAIEVCDLATVRSLDLSQYSGVITIEEPEPEHIQQALTFARETDGPLLVHCRAGVSRSTAIALAIATDCLGVGNERQACEWLKQVCPQAQPNWLIVSLADQILNSNKILIRETERAFWHSC